MKKKISVVLIAVLFGVVSFNLSLQSKKTTSISDILLDNIEALAQELDHEVGEVNCVTYEEWYYDPLSGEYFWGYMTIVMCNYSGHKPCSCN